MSDQVRLSAALPGNEEINGLDAYEARLHMTPLPFDQMEGRTEKVEVLQPEDVQG